MLRRLLRLPVQPLGEEMYQHAAEVLRFSSPFTGISQPEEFWNSPRVREGIAALAQAVKDELAARK